MAVTIQDPLISAKARCASHRGFQQWDESLGQQLIAHGENPFCGDELEIRLSLVPAERGGACIARAAFDGYGCTLCMAAAEVVAEHIEGMTVVQAASLTFDDVCSLLGGLEVGRTRKGCVELASHIIGRALAPMVK